MPAFDEVLELDRVSKSFDVEIFVPLLVNGIKPMKIELTATVRRMNKPMALDAALGYVAMDKSDSDVTRVQNNSDGIVEIIQSSDDVALVTDTSNLVVPPNCFFRTLFMDFQRPINIKWAKLLGLQAAMATDVKIAFVLRRILTSSTSVVA